MSLITDENSYDDVLPQKKWEFNEEVSDCFDNMLERSIPGYFRMRELVFNFGKQYVQAGTDIVDIGCSLGNAMAPFLEEFGSECQYIGIEQSKPMYDRFRNRFDREIQSGLVTIFNEDISFFYPEACASLVLSVLTLQFVPVEHRERILKQIYNSLTEHGAFILVEKCSCVNNEIEKIFEKTYYDLKRENGYTEEQIISKKNSLVDYLRPLSRDENKKLLNNAGFNNVECIWADIMFTAWIAVKE